MKKTFLFKSCSLLFTILLVIITIVSCTTEDNINAKKATVTGFVLSQSNLTTLGIALEKTNLLATLDAQGTYTLFAPTNDAFNSFLTANGFSSINDVPTTTLKEILLNHVIGQTLTTTDLPASGYIKTLAKGNVSATNTLSMYVNKSNDVVLNNFSKVTAANVLASNGIVYVVNTVIGLPTVSSHIIANPNLTSFLGIITDANQPDFITTFYGTGPFTVFAPTNNAFNSLNTELSGGIAGVSASDMTKIIHYHVVSGNILSSNLTDGQIVPTLEAPQTFTVLLNSAPRLKDVNNRSSNIITTDIQCTNGVIHLLNKALLPSL